MSGEKNALFRDAALARLASPERLDARLQLMGYPRLLLALAAILLLAVALFAAWLLTAR
jgi:hypothetical protein